jgi:hypothetical protein
LQYDDLVEVSDLFKSVGEVRDALSCVGSQHLVQQA